MRTTKVSERESSSLKTWFRTAVSQTALESGDEYSMDSQQGAFIFAPFQSTVSAEASCESCRVLPEECPWLLMKDDSRMSIKKGYF